MQCFGTVVYNEPYELRAMSLSQHTRKSLQLSLSHFRSLLIARSLECDIGPCLECEEKKLGLRGGDVCANCGEADNIVRCIACEGKENGRRRCASCRRCAPTFIYLGDPAFTNGMLGAFVLNAVIKSWNRHCLVKMLVARSRRPTNS